jgi:hypothetical protein
VLAEILERWRQNRALRKFSQSVLGDALRIHTQKYLNETVLRGVSSEFKQKLVEQFSIRLFAIDRSPNPFLTFREELCGAAVAYAELQVLSLTPQEKAETFGDDRYISGELSRYIRQAADFNEDVARIIWEHPECTDDELITLADVRCAVFLYYLNGWNLVRVATKIDPAHSADKDWFRPFVTSMLISSEHNARKKLGLPSLFIDDIAPLRHASFMSGVANGQANPLFEWEHSYRRKHREES